MGGVDGVLAHPPQPNVDDVLLPTLRKTDLFTGEHAVEMDVTGGIGLKVERGFQATAKGIEVLLVNGEKDRRVADACMGKDVVGTRLLA